LLKQAGQHSHAGKPTLKLNPRHAILDKLKGLDEAPFNDYAELLLDQALLAEGAALEQPGEFVKRLNRLLLG
jgi:molecular chaperone HtpG